MDVIIHYRFPEPTKMSCMVVGSTGCEMIDEIPGFILDNDFPVSQLTMKLCNRGSTVT
jgi:hypothetical protein